MQFDQQPCTVLKGVGGKVALHLANAGIETLFDLVFHLPRDHQDKTQITSLSEVKAEQVLLFEGVIEQCQVIYQQGKSSLHCTLRDLTGKIRLRFFHFSMAQKNQLQTADKVRCFGKVQQDRQGLIVFHPEYQAISKDKKVALDKCLTPVYPNIEGVSQKILAKLIKQAIQLLSESDANLEKLPPSLLERYQLIPIEKALSYLHTPPVDVDKQLLQQGKHPMQQRLALDELLAMQLSLRQARSRQQSLPAPSLPEISSLISELIKNLPFNLTDAQQRVIQQIKQDLKSTAPMLRLLQGDVGAGKTVVAAVSLLHAVDNGWQAALMAPTEILAEQHFKTLQQWLEPLDIQCAWLSGSLANKEKNQALAQIQQGQAQIIVGTHALFQQQVQFAKLGLIVIDEQHRFGVEQRLAFSDKGANQGIKPHQLVMTATPIPRSLAMTAYADLDYSVIDELPKGRKPITTVALENSRREEVIERIRVACAQKRQAYWVCTLIDESEKLTCQAAESQAELLRACLPELTIGLVHGRLSADEKEQLMRAFKAGEIDLLVATTVIEVGVDVSNASLMIIENPERLGLAQLHQLRGRVGRGEVASFCVLLYQAPLSELAFSRLDLLRRSQDGFEIAEFDLKLRGPGEILGTRQAGSIDFRFADLIRDQSLIHLAQQLANELLQEYPELVQKIVFTWIKNKNQFASV